MFFFVSTKNLNWEILTKNLVILLTDGMELRMRNFNIMGVHWKIWFLRGLHKKNIMLGGNIKGENSKVWGNPTSPISWFINFKHTTIAPSHPSSDIRKWHEKNLSNK